MEATPCNKSSNPKVELCHIDAVLCKAKWSLCPFEAHGEDLCVHIDQKTAAAAAILLLNQHLLSLLGRKQEPGTARGLEA